ncbi:phosphate ABC transporter permease PstA [Halochromatium glycolicum]|uniref:Phosphate transport system permease protein PstA n=1 Tax=Halochromatium glycolicum TaxID=85075 RepID=A0AAJ0U4N5_9GAMM|nr:phosphate ABC transporter permease PstA [Halochromatium glycolicum]MBK1705189.1 phosphate ABC transporter, permease protein PstA [Halochromatium glycolicum]
MTESAPNSTGSVYLSKRFTRRLRRRRGREHLLRAAGVGAVMIAIGMLAVLFTSIVLQGDSAFLQTRIALEVDFDLETLGVDSAEREALEDGSYRTLLHQALYDRFGRPEARAARDQLTAMVSDEAVYRLRDRVLNDPNLIGQTQRIWMPAASEVDLIAKGVVPRDLPEADRLVSDRVLGWMGQLREAGDLKTVFNTDFFIRTDSREPEVAGIRGAIVGSALMLLVTLVTALPVGLAAAVYLEEFAPKNRWTELIDVNIRNLAAVPSILFGLLGLAVFVRLFGMPRSTPLVGGLVLALLVLPTIIIAARAAIQAVPPSLREAAQELGASRMQTTFLTVLPNALPGILTGTIISMAEALGETAPLLMIGMVAFIAEMPTDFNDPAAPLPVLVYLWSTSPERGFFEKTAAAILVLLAFLLVMNALAVWLRMRTQKRG